MRTYKNNRYQPLKIFTGYRWITIEPKAKKRVNVDVDSDHVLSLAKTGYLSIIEEPKTKNEPDAKSGRPLSPSARRRKKN